MNTLLDAIDQKKRILDARRPFPVDLVKNLDQWFTVELTYNSNAIEGNTLSRAETALVVEKGIVVEGKTLVEHLEAVNHAAAFSWVRERAVKRTRVSLQDVLELHRLILSKIDDSNAGRYRTVSVRIAGSRVVLPNPAKISTLMGDFSLWLGKAAGHPATVASQAHLKLVTIHPFVDGNGRTARLLMNLLLLASGYPPAIIRTQDRRRYITSIEAAQLGGEVAEYYSLMYESVDRSLSTYLEALDEKSDRIKLESKPFLTIGQVAKLTGETVPTIRFWTTQGLLSATGRSAGGYQLYGRDVVGLAQKIRTLQRSKRLLLSEIKSELARSM